MLCHWTDTECAYCIVNIVHVCRFVCERCFYCTKHVTCWRVEEETHFDVDAILLSIWKIIKCNRPLPTTRQQDYSFKCYFWSEILLLFCWCLAFIIIIDSNYSIIFSNSKYFDIFLHTNLLFIYLSNVMLQHLAPSPSYSPVIWFAYNKSYCYTKCQRMWLSTQCAYIVQWKIEVCFVFWKLYVQIHRSWNRFYNQPNNVLYMGICEEDDDG